MATVNDCLIQLQKLTRQNLDILQTINDSFITNKSHLSVKIDDTNFAIPSFISLENKINNLQDNFNNLINAPKTGEAYFNFDGNSRAIEVRGYTHTPESIELNAPSTFNVETNNIFKDFTTPTPYINFNLPENLSGDITTVNIKKIIPINTELKTFLSELIEESNVSTQYKYSELYKKLYAYQKDIDYIEYDTLKKLPLRKNIGSGIYVIENIISDTIDENLDEYITLKIRNNIDNSSNESYLNKFYYKQFDETLEFPLHVGDQLVTFDDSAKVEIVELRQNANTMVVKVLNGEYLNLTAESEEINPSNITNLAKLKYFSSQYNDNKYVKVSLEEDDLIYIAISVVNDRMNIQSPWGTGVIINTTNLLDSNGNKYKDFYNANVSNVGDVLVELVKMLPGELTKLSEDDFNNLKTVKPEINIENLQVIQINKHLNNSTTVKNIRSLYSQKLKYQQDLNDVQEKITDINTQLSSISFQDTDNLKDVYTQQLTELTKNKNSILTSITKIIDEISLAANSSDVPIENAKYHIRGFYDITDKHIKGIKVYYRYKNIDNTTGNASTIGENFLFSDWNVMDNFLNTKEVYYDNGYNFKEKEDNSTKNEPSFNQIDIPISQGETVDIKLQLIYDYCYPYAELTSDWSEVVNIEFPKEYLKDIQILDIISENNNDIETNRFKNILTENGVLEHVADKVTDQDITYFHSPDKIASGFYTTERRVIPLKDKLTELINKLTILEDEIMGSSSNAIDVSVSVGENNYSILPLQENNIFLKGFNEFSGDPSVVNRYSWDGNTVTTTANITLTNNSTHSVKLYPLFIGNSDSPINDNQNNTKNLSNYVLGDIRTIEDLKEKLYEIEISLKNNWDEHAKFNKNIRNLTGQIDKLYIDSSNSYGTHYLIVNGGFDDDDKLYKYKSSDTDKLFNIVSNNKKSGYGLVIPYKLYITEDKKPNDTGWIDVDKSTYKNSNISGNLIIFIKKEILDKLMAEPNDTIINIKESDLINDSINIKYKLGDTIYNISTTYGYVFLPNTLGNIEFNYYDTSSIFDGFDNLDITITQPNGNNQNGFNFYIESIKFEAPIMLSTAYFSLNDDKEIYNIIGPGSKYNDLKSNVSFTYQKTAENSAKQNKIIALSTDTNTGGESDTNTSEKTNDSTNKIFTENGDVKTSAFLTGHNNKYNGVWMLGYKDNELKAFIQTNNQLMYFRTCKINSDKDLYIKNDSNKITLDGEKKFIYAVNNILPGTTMRMDLAKYNKKEVITGVSVYPYLSNVHSLICNNIGYVSYHLLTPGESISVPVLIKYRLDNTVNDVKKTLSFDIKTSLYNDPINYEFTINCKTQLSDIERSLMENKVDQIPVKYTSTVTK